MYRVIILHGIKGALFLQMLPAVFMKEMVADNDIKVILLKISCIEFGRDIIPFTFLRLWVNT